MGARRRRRQARRFFAAILLLALLGAAAYLYAARAPPEARPPPTAEGVLRVHYVDVGQGDATVWELPDGGLVVYDCGPPAPSAAANPLVAYLRDRLGREAGATIHALIASHGHLDHVGGCDELLDEYRILHVYEAWYEGADAPESYRRFQEEVRAEGATLHRLPELQPGQDLAVPGVRATLLWPSAFSPGGWDEIAESSLVIRLEHGATAFCFQGDIETQQERALAASGGEARCDAYLVGHHGSRFASSAAWLARMDPSLAVASFGENAYGHPTAEALCRIQQAGARILATQRAGDIILASNGERVAVERGVEETRDYCAPDASYWS